MITQLKLDEASKLEFGVSITGTDGTPTARFVIEGPYYSMMFPCSTVNESLDVTIPSLKGALKSGEYSARLEIVIENKIYVPLSDTIVFEPLIEMVVTKPTAKQSVVEQVKVINLGVKKINLNEDSLRKTQAATIIAQTLKYAPQDNETPQQIIENALKNAKNLNLTDTQKTTVAEMVKLAESIGITLE